MRILTSISLLLAGCGHGFPGGAALALAGVGTAATIAEIAIEHHQREEAERQARSEPVTTSVRDVEERGRWACPSLRQFRVVCVTAAAGRSCFYETDDGQVFDCRDERCVEIPRGIDEWCAIAAPRR
jgi:hypothetical protein